VDHKEQVVVGAPSLSPWGGDFCGVCGGLPRSLGSCSVFLYIGGHLFNNKVVFYYYHATILLIIMCVTTSYWEVPCSSSLSQCQWNELHIYYLMERHDQKPHHQKLQHAWPVVEQNNPYCLNKL
jgi:hypothetical protein